MQLIPPTDPQRENPTSADGREKCRGQVRQEDGTRRRCHNWPVRGTTVCRKHGANAPQVKAKARRIVAELEVRRELKSMIDGIPAEPKELGLVLMSELARCEGALDYLSGRLADLGDDMLESNWLSGTSSTHPLVVLYGQWSDRRAKLAESCVKLGLEDRRVRLAESDRAALAGALRGALDDAGVADVDRAAVLAALAARLRRLES